MKIIPMYLPQFHSIPENDAWWGEGFTEWTNMKKAKSLFAGHYQPRIPLNNNYYNLSNIETIKWQCNLAKEYGIYGFCFYHYWFNGHKLLEKPMELFLADKSIDFKFCISWANENWTNGWVSENNKILIGHNFDDENDWTAHFNYLLPFLKDPRYICEDGKPLFVIYVPHHIRKLPKMLALWNQMAINEGLKGLKFIYQNVRSHLDQKMDKSLFDYGIEFQPGYTLSKSIMKPSHRKAMIWGPKISSFLQKFFGIHLGTLLMRIKKNNLSIVDYDEVWRKTLELHPDNDKMVPSAFIDWDNTPRRGEKGRVFIGASPEKFKTYFKQMVLNTRNIYKKDMLFVFAWNEWAEGGYLEPDQKFGYGYLSAIKEVVQETNELENI